MGQVGVRVGQQSLQWQVGRQVQLAGACGRKPRANLLASFKHDRVQTYPERESGTGFTQQHGQGFDLFARAQPVLQCDEDHRPP